MFQQSTKDYIFFLACHESFYKTDHIVCHKASLNSYNKNKILDHCGLKLDFNNNNRHTRRHIHSWKLNKSLLNDLWARKEVKVFLELNENEDTMYSKLMDKMKAVLRGKFITLSASIKKL